MSTLKIKRENGKIFCPLADSWHIETPEEKVRQEYIKILVEDYGYSLDQMAQEIKVNNSQRGQGKARADIVIWKSKQDKIESKAAFIVVECKAENVRIREEDYYQGYNYASWAGASFFVTTKLKVKALIAVAEKELRDLEKAIIEEAKPLTKEYFDYEIPIAMVEDAGITSTGAVSAGNQLPTLQDEYKEYRIAKKLWNEANSVVSYIINSQGRLFRTSDGKEVELKW